MPPQSQRGNAFYGEKIRSFKENVFSSRVWRKNMGEKGKKNLKPGVAYSVLTRDINKEMAVSSLKILNFFRSDLLWPSI